MATALSAAAVGHPDAVVSRMGGDEFCVLLPGGDAEAALAVCENAAAYLEAGDRRTIAISCGIAALSPELDRPAALLRGADFAQYSAKRTGPDALPAGERAYRGPSRARRDLPDELLAIVRARNGAGADSFWAG